MTRVVSPWKEVLWVVFWVVRGAPNESPVQERYWQERNCRRPYETWAIGKVLVVLVVQHHSCYSLTTVQQEYPTP